MKLRPLIFLAFLLFVPLVAFAAGDGMTVTEMAVTTKIVRGNPIDSVHRISFSSVPALFCFTRIARGDGEETTIRHLWYRENVKVADYELPVRGEKWRTYSRKTIDRESPGEWRVDAVDPSGKVLKSVAFRIN
jgi:hypothetical protein